MSGLQMECLPTSLVLKTTTNMVEIVGSTGSCPMETGQSREISGVNTTTICCQKDHTGRSDLSKSTTRAALMASPTSIRRAHYSGRLD